MARIQLDTTLPDGVFPLGAYLGVAYIENGKADVPEEILQHPKQLARIGATAPEPQEEESEE